MLFLFSSPVCVCVCSSLLKRRRLPWETSPCLPLVNVTLKCIYQKNFISPAIFCSRTSKGRKHKEKVMTPHLRNRRYIPHICTHRVIINNFCHLTHFLLFVFPWKAQKEEESNTKSLTSLPSSLSCSRATTPFLDLILLVNKTLLKFNNKLMVQVWFLSPFSLSHTDLYRSKRTTFDISRKIKKHNLAIFNQSPHVTTLDLLNSFQTQMSHKYASYSFKITSK